jgi:hypothetical protein
MKPKGKSVRFLKGGIIGYILIIIAVVIVLGYFGFDLRGILESPQVQENLQYVWNIVKPPIIWVWNLIEAVWNAVVSIPDSFGNNFESIAPESRINTFEGQ